MKKWFSSILAVSVLVTFLLVPASARHPADTYFDAGGYLTEEGYAVITGCMPDVEYIQVVEGNAVFLFANDPDTGELFLAYKVYRDPDGDYPTVVSAGYIVGQTTTKRLPDGYNTYSPERLDQGILNVPIVGQDDHNCWAAVCAMIIAYKTSTFRTAAELCYEVTGQYDVSGSWTQIKQCYNNYGFSPSQISGICPYSTVRNYITADQPLHIGCVQLDSNGNDTNIKHSMALIGFDGISGTCYLFANDPSTQKRVCRAVNPAYTTDDPIIFNLDGGLRVRWNMTRYGFYK